MTPAAATLVSFHAHPDDEAIGAGGTLAQAAAEGHRVVVVFATRGEHGEVPDGVLGPGELLAERRVAEAEAAAAILGVHRLEFLDYTDSGLAGADTNSEPRSFWSAPLEEAAQRLAAVLLEEGARVLTAYDRHGITGHPDHVRVHQVGLRAAALAGTERVYEGTLNRTRFETVLARAAKEGGADLPDGIDPQRLGTPEEQITTAIDVSGFLDIKRRAMAAHATQITEVSPLLAMPGWAFAELWGTEWYIRRDLPAGAREHGLFDGLD